MRERLSQLTHQMQAPSATPEPVATSTPQQQVSAPVHHSYAVPPGPALHAGSGSSTTPLAPPTALTTPESEKAMARRLRILIGAQMCEPNVLRAGERAGLEFDLEDEKIARKRKQAAR
eukprot:3119553-Pleurochrysis_carterae.AAC.3